MAGTDAPLWPRMAELLRPFRRRAITVAGLLVLTTALGLAGPLILRHTIDHGLTGDGADMGVVNRSGATYLAVVALTLVLVRLQTRMVAQVGEGFVQALRRRVFDHIMSLSPRFFDRTPSGVLVSPMTADIDALQLLVDMGLVQLVQSLLLLLLLATLLGVLSWKLALVCLVLAPPVVWATRRFRRNSRAAYLQVRNRVGETIAALVESVNGVREVQAMNQQDRSLASLVDHNQRQYEANRHSTRVQARYLPVMELVPVLCSCLALGLGGVMVMDGDLTLGTLTAFLLYLQMTFEPVQSVSFQFNQVQSGGAALRKLFALLDTPSDLPAGSSPLPTRGTVELHRVSFRYDAAGPAVLQDVDLVVRHGEKLALVGPTGAGKATLARLVARLHDPTEGSITYGGVDLRDADPSELRRQVVMVTQDSHVFSGTVRDNIRVARPAASDADVAAAVARIGADTVLGALPQGLDTPAGPGGSQLSAGQRQLIALARAAVLDSDVLILDEATSDLDPGTELTATLAMAELMRDRTVIVIAHRLSTILEADRIAVVADGGIAELGTHGELLARGGRYAALHAGWLRSEEPRPAVPLAPR